MARSPNYPKLNLEEAIERIRQVYRAEHTHPADKEVVAQDLGYKSVNGSSARLITALKHYGLLEEQDQDRVRVSDDAMTILELPRDDPDRARALQDAAFAPQVFADLQETYEGRPPSDVNIRHYLLRKKFLPQAADDVIRLYRDNLELVAREAPEYTAEVVEDDPSEVETPMQPTEVRSGGSTAQVISGGGIVEPRASVAPATVLQFQISKNSAARIELTGDVTQEAIERLALILDAQKLVFPEENELKQAAVESPPEQSAIELPAPEQQ